MTNTNTNTYTDTAPRWLGPVLVLASAVLFSFSGVLTKAIDAGSWTILTWRGLFGGVGIAIYVWVRNSHRPIREVFRLGRHGWFIATVGAIGSVTFIVSSSPAPSNQTLAPSKASDLVWKLPVAFE